MSKEVLIKSGMQITQTDFSCNKTENMQVRCVPQFIQRFLRFFLFFTCKSCRIML